MAFEKGNRLGARAKVFEHELRKEIAQGDPERLRRIAIKLLERAEEGDLFAIREVADRLDGKATQTVHGVLEHVVHVGDQDSFADKIEYALSQRAPTQVQ